MRRTVLAYLGCPVDAGPVLLIVGWEAVNGCIIEGASIFETYQRVAESKRLVTMLSKKSDDSEWLFQSGSASSNNGGEKWTNHLAL
ncbi:MAG: hypothetical protein FJY85_14010, partial [Deltaproteobacteria bacterium]|nr:hypothetical protein [Deltaproteobacteria bacterium]